MSNNKTKKDIDEMLKKVPGFFDAPEAYSNNFGITVKKIQTLPTDSAERKTYPMLSGCLKYFPAAIAGVAHISKLGNDKHNPGQPLHHARGKSTDHGDCILRHLTDVEDLIAARDRGNPEITQEMILLEASQLAWRALAYSQALHESFGYPMAPAAKEETPSVESKIVEETRWTFPHLSDKEQIKIIQSRIQNLQKSKKEVDRALKGLEKNKDDDSI